MDALLAAVKAEQPAIRCLVLVRSSSRNEQVLDPWRRCGHLAQRVSPGTAGSLVSVGEQYDRPTDLNDHRGQRMEPNVMLKKLLAVLFVAV